MSRRVFLHIGAPKTGTTYLQDRLARNASALADHDVHFPTRSPLVRPTTFHFRAALDLLGQDWGGPPGHAEGHWDALMKRVRRRSGTVIISHEILAPARPDQVSQVMADLSGSEIHVVYSARDLGRSLPAAWQESIKQGRSWSFRRFLRRARRGQPWFYHALDVPSVLGTWGAGLPPERIHVVTVPPSAGGYDGARRGENPLWSRFCEAVQIDPAWAPLDSDRTNRSLGMAETQLIRALNARLDKASRREPPYRALIDGMLAQRTLVTSSPMPIRLPPADFAWAEETTERWIEYLEQSGVDVIGDLADLRPIPPPEGTPWRAPDRVPARKQLRVSLDALAAMTREAAARPDPNKQLVERVRRGANRLRNK